METVENTDYVLSLVTSINVTLLQRATYCRPSALPNCVSFSAKFNIILSYRHSIRPTI